MMNTLKENHFLFLHIKEAFDATMGEFVLRSQERKRFVVLRALQRRMEELEADKRQRLFGLESRHTLKTLTDPTAGKLFGLLRKEYCC